MSDNRYPYPWQRPLWSNLQAGRRAGRLAHALLFTGSAGLGKQRLLEALAQSLLCEAPDEEGIACGHCRSCTLFAAGNHPDLLRIEPEEAGKAIGVDAVRAVARFQNLSAQYGRHQVVLIRPAEAMNTHAANALLKTLEEPSADTMLLLASDRPASLLPTIRSRCQQWAVSAGPEAEHWLHEQLQQRGRDEAAATLLALGGGAPLTALQLVDEELLELRHSCFEQWASLRTAGEDPVVVAAQWAKLEAARLLGWLHGWLGDLLRIKSAPGSAPLTNPDLAGRLQALADGVDLGSIVDAIDRVEKALARIRGQQNRQMMFEEMLLAWSLYRRAA